MSILLETQTYIALGYSWGHSHSHKCSVFYSWADANNELLYICLHKHLKAKGQVNGQPNLELLTKTNIFYVYFPGFIFEKEYWKTEEIVGKTPANIYSKSDLKYSECSNPRNSLLWANDNAVLFMFLETKCKVTWKCKYNK